MYFDHNANGVQHNSYQTYNQHGDPYSGQYPTPPPLPAMEADTEQYSIPISATAAYHTPTQNTVDARPISIPYNHRSPASDQQYIDVSSSDQEQYYFGTYRDAFEQEQEPLSSNKISRKEQESQREFGFFSRWSNAKNKTEKTQNITTGISAVGPTLAPENEKESYKMEPFEAYIRKRPSFTCTTYLCFLLFFILFGGGIALMIVSKVFRDQCSGQCGGDASNDTFCQARCNSTLRSVMLYAGAVLTGLGGLGILWQLIKWRCCMRR